VVVEADMALVRKYEIPLQELPLLCVRLLQSWTADADGTAVLSEKEMIEYGNRRKEAKSGRTEATHVSGGENRRRR